MKSNLVLIGFMGSGKSTIGRYLEKTLEMKLVDLDHYIEKKNKMSIREIFDRYGEDKFRKLEVEACKEISKLNNVIVSTGGGIVLNRKNIDELEKDSLIIYLDVDRNTLYRRLKNSKNRPLLDGEKLWEKINTTMDFRQKLYEESANYTIYIKNEDTFEVADKVKKIYIEKG